MSEDSRCELLRQAIHEIGDAVLRSDFVSVEAAISRVEELVDKSRGDLPEYPSALKNETARVTAILARSSATVAALLAVHATAAAQYPTPQLGER